MSRPAIALAALLFTGCATQIVETATHEHAPPAWRVLVVAPFRVPAAFAIEPPEPGEVAADAADLAARLTRAAAEVFGEAGFEVVPASDLVHSYAARGETLPLGDVAALAQRAAADFGATALLSGRLTRFRERRGGGLGTTQPARVGFELAAHAAPTGRLLWTARFEHTQKAISEDVLRARSYPGAGTRWLSAAELARWGLAAAARSALEQR